MYTIIHAIVGYIFLLLTVRLLARRPGAQMTLFEFVLIFLIGGIIILATAGDDHSMVNCIAGVTPVALMHRCISYVRRKSPRAAALIDGKPVVLLKDGQWQMEAMRGMHIDDSDVMAAARTKGVRSLDEIKYAILERNGGISIISK